MAISVTSIPRSIVLSEPAFTLGTANSAGAAQTAVSSNSTLLVYDTTVPANISSASAVGDATTAARRNHVHGGQVDISCKIYNNATVSIANNSTTVLAFPSELYDTDTMHDPTTNNSRITIKTAGKYIVMGRIKWSSNTTGRRQIFLLLNGSLAEGTEDSSNQAHHHYQEVCAEMDLDVDDYVELQAYQTSGGSLDSLQMNSLYPGLAAIKVLA